MKKWWKEQMEWIRSLSNEDLILLSWLSLLWIIGTYAYIYGTNPPP